MMATPRALSARMRSNRRCDSFSVSAAVGSSRMRRRAFLASARAMTTSCWVARSSDDIGGFGIDVEVEVGERAPGAAQPLGDVDHAPARRFVVEGDVLGDRQVGDDIDLLRHERDAGCLRRRRRRRAGYGAPAKVIVAVIASGGVRAGEDLDQRRLAGAVLAEQRDDLAGRDREARHRRARARREELGRGCSRRGAARGAERPAAGAGRSSRSVAAVDPRPPIGRSASCPGRSCRPRRCSASNGCLQTKSAISSWLTR